jgi:beta-lactamase regulating signal transducer with metallopeptidase domain
MGSLVWEPWAASLLRHLWQSTVFTAGVWLLTLALRRNAARLRYLLWMTASLKFLLPFSLLIAAGARLSSPGHFDHAKPKIVTVVGRVAQPLLEAWPADATTPVSLARIGTGGTTALASADWLPLLLLSAWAAGTLLLLARWMRSWRHLRATVRRGEPVALADGTPALMVAESVEPGIFGIIRPVLVLPRGIAERLSPEQLDAIMAHELSHMRRRDNLTAALHMLVESVFWFHPLVWWLEARLVEERERACDEAVLESRRRGNSECLQVLC